MPFFAESIFPVSVLSKLHAASVIIFPTETLYGIGCSIWHEEAVARVFEIKGRALDQPPPVLFANANQLNILAENISPSARLLIKRFWPGELTLILPARSEIPDALCGFNAKHNTRTIGIRQTANRFAAALCIALQSPVVATSANFSGASGRAAKPQNLADIPVAFKELVDVVIDGATVGGMPSTIVDCVCEPPRVLRVGAIALAELQKVSPAIQAT